MSYTDSIVKYNRRRTAEVKIGKVALGGDNPIRIQTMLNTDTNNTAACVDQAVKCIESGSEYIRITAQGEKEARNLALIKEELAKKGYIVPIIADIHFNPKAAEIAATIIEKVRINPGNYTDKKRLKPEDLSEKQYQEELERIKQRFIPLLNICKMYKTAIRIGTNHGSLSDRIMGRFGDTPEGMAESAMEFLRICKAQDFHSIVLSMKASNTRIMVYATRLLVKKMKDENMYYPLHLGVTEAGDGEDGRIKSAVGIGTLLTDGIGDTIRVSLTENPELELPVARKIVNHFKEMNDHKVIEKPEFNPVNPFYFNRRNSEKINNIGGGQAPVVVADFRNIKNISDELLFKCGFKKTLTGWKGGDQSPDYIISDCDIKMLNGNDVKLIVPEKHFYKVTDQNISKLYNIEDIEDIKTEKNTTFIQCLTTELNTEEIKKLKKFRNTVLLLKTENRNRLADLRFAVIKLINLKCNIPVIFLVDYGLNKENIQISAACDFGGLFIDGLGDGLLISSDKKLLETGIKTAFQILQSTGDRITKTEYISCPSCGRTHFDLLETLAKIKIKTAHLKGLKIGVMGCIVNGPGEMADAHYGYVGAGKGKITLYKGHEIIERSIPSDQAVDKLIEIIKMNGDWKEKL